jgi:transposase
LSVSTRSWRASYPEHSPANRRKAQYHAGGDAAERQPEALAQNQTEHIAALCAQRHPERLSRCSATDKEALPEVQDRLAKRELLSEQHLVDAGYVTAGHLVESQRKHGIDLLGPIVKDSSWQAKEGKGFAISDFEIDWENKRATCPQGKVSGRWQPARDEFGMEVVYIDFLKKDCSVCPALIDCTEAKTQRRTITVNAQSYYEAMVAARARQQTPKFKKEYQARAGIEGTISQGVRAAELRKARYRGLIKTHFQHYATAAGINLLRLGAWWLGKPREKTRRSPFLSLAPEST